MILSLTFVLTRKILILTNGFTCGTFDLFHAGHIIFLSKCKADCDKLTVGLHIDPSIERPLKNKPVQSVLERFIQLADSKYVDHIIPYETEADLEVIYNMYAMDRRFLGEEYIQSVNTGDYICKSLGIQTVFIARPHSFSSTELRGRIYNTEKKRRKK